mgnify:CR=1 FL=1
MAIQMSMDIRVLVIKDLYKDYLNDSNTTGVKMHLYSMAHDDDIIKVGNVKNNGNEYTVCIIKNDDMLYDNLFVSDFAFETQLIFNTQYHPEPSIERDLKLVKSKETPSGFNLSEYFNGEITEDMSHHDFFSDIANLLVEKNNKIVNSLLKYFTDMANHYLFCQMANYN